MNKVDLCENIGLIEPPLSQDVARELVNFWQTVFKASYEHFWPILTGSESAQNHDIIYLIRKGQILAGTSHLTISQANLGLGGLGEVATASDFRGMGVARALCARARDDFLADGGQALFLGTSNPAAARVYRRLGWRKLAGANVMVFIADGNLPEAFLVDYFREGGVVAIAAGSASDRIPMIPLLFSPHDWHIMDANTGMVSIRYAVQNSCMGLYPQYESLAASERGTWFTARTDRGRTVGLSTARLDGVGGCQVDGFTHHNYLEAWESLIAASISWATAYASHSCWARVSLEDEEKIGRFETLGFRQIGVDEPFQLGETKVKSVRLERNT